MTAKTFGDIMREVEARDGTARRRQWRTVLDNQDGRRNGYALGEALEYDAGSGPVSGDRGRGILLFGALELRDGDRAVYLIDDLSTVRPYYVAGYQPGGVSPANPDGCAPYVIVHPMPAGGPHISWELGPRRAYHVKLTD